MRVLVVNAGSSSLKLSLLGGGDGDGDGHGDRDVAVAAEEIEEWDGRSVSEALGALWDAAGGTSVDAVGHRVVHGGSDLVAPVIVDDEVCRRIDALSSLAPLHQGASLAGIRALQDALPDVAQVACFDTAFHATLPPEAATYALSAAWRSRFVLRRFGFHGFSHAYVARRAAELVGRPVEELRTVSCHLGSGASLCAIAGGRSVDTTMGLTPLEGLVMATRSGSVDPGLVLWLLQEGGLSVAEVKEGLEHGGGLAGLMAGSGGARQRGDLRTVLAERAAGAEAAILAFDVYLHRLCRELAAMTAALGGLDVVAFTGGVGERSAEVRSAVADRLGYLGITVDPARNAGHGDRDLATADAPVHTLVIGAREDVEIARQVRRLLQGG